MIILRKKRPLVAHFKRSTQKNTYRTIISAIPISFCKHLPYNISEVLNKKGGKIYDRNTRERDRLA